MISHKHKSVFIHVPKCGGTSVEHVLEPIGFAHHGYHYHQTHNQVLSNNKIKDYFKFSFTRNPFDKLVSEFKWYTDQSNVWNSKETKEYYKNDTFKTFVKKFISHHVGDPFHRMTQFEILYPHEDINHI